MQDEIRLRCTGTATPASRLVPYAIGIVNRLREVDSFGYQQAVGENWRIDVKLNNGHATITIHEDGDVGDGACPSYMSGMTVHGVRIRKTDPAKGAKLAGLWSCQPSPVYAAKAKLSTGWQIGKYGRATPASFAPTPAQSPGSVSTIPPSWLPDGWSQAALLKPGLYSGTMRNVVQTLLGSDAQVQYEFSFGKTHGIYVRHTNAGRADWLIEISRDNGVMAMKLPVCKSSVPKENTLGYVPTGETFPTGSKLSLAIARGTVRQLLLPADLAPAYDKSAFSDLFGWAFKYDGTAASVVVYTQAKYKTTYIYTVHLVGDDTGPVSASLSMDVSGEVVSPSFSSITGYGEWAFKVPLQPGGTAYPIDFGPTSGTYAEANTLAPLHVWYEKSGARSTVWYRNGVTSYGRPADENRRPRLSSLPFDGAPIQHWGSDPANYGVEFVEYNETLTGSYSSQYGPAAYVNDAPGAHIVAPTRYTYKALISGTAMECVLSTYTACNVFSRGVLREYDTSFNGYTRRINSAVVIPAFEREAALQNTVTSQFADSMGYVNNSYSATYGSKQYQNYDYDTINYPQRSDGMPLSGVFRAVGSAGFDGSIGVGPYQIDNGYSLSAVPPIDGVFGGFSQSAGSPGVPDEFSPPAGFTLNTPGNPYAALEPFSTIGTTYSWSSRRMRKVLFCSGKRITLNNDVDDDLDSPEVMPPLGPWFDGATGLFYPLIQSHDGELRYSPPDLTGGGQSDFSKSDLGDYSIPEAGSELFLNFVGDA